MSIRTDPLGAAKGAGRPLDGGRAAADHSLPRAVEAIPDEPTRSQVAIPRGTVKQPAVDPRLIDRRATCASAAAPGRVAPPHRSRCAAQY